MIERCTQVNSDLQAEVDRLVAESAGADGFRTAISMDVTLNAFDRMKCAFGYRVDGELAGFLFVFAPTANEIEISALVLPRYRRQGIFHRLLDSALAECAGFGYRRGLLLCNADSTVGREVAAHLGLQLGRVEYQMEMESRPSPEHKEDGFALEPITLADVDAAVPLMAETFDSNEETERTYLNRSIQTDGRTNYVLKRLGQTVGFGGTQLEGAAWYLFGLGVLPGERRRGYGRRLLDLLVQIAADSDVRTLLLDVDSENPNALSLYRSYGFMQRSATEYYEIRFGGNPAPDPQTRGA